LCIVLAQQTDQTDDCFTAHAKATTAH